MPRPRKEYFGESDPSDNDSENSSDREFEKRIMMDEPKREDSEPAEILDSDYCLNYPGEYFTHQIDNIISHRTKYMHSEITNHLKKEEENQNSQGSINDDIQDILEANEKEKEKYKEEEVEDEVKLEKGKIKRTKKSKKKQDSIKEAQQEPQAENTMKEPEERQEKNYANLTEDDFIFLIKFVNKSHHYCKWMTQTEIVNHSAEGEQKLKRYKSRMMKHGGLLPTQCVYDDAFDPSYLQVERILFTTNMFPVVHPRLVKKTEGTWLEDLQKVMCILLNFSKRTHNIGLHFLDINYNPENDENRKKSPDFLTLLNRLYTKKITTQVQFW